jgi:hypothetical protein
MASLEREKYVAMTNPTKGKGKKKKSGKKKKGGHKKKGRTTNPSKRKGHGGGGKAPKQRRKYKRNPGVDLKGTALAQLGGHLGGLIAQPVAHLANHSMLTPNKDGKTHPTLAKVLRVVVPEALGFGLGLAAGMVQPSLGKGVAGGAGAVATMHGMSVLANAGDKPPEILAKMGFAQLGAVSDYYAGDDGHVYRAMPDGTSQLMFGVNRVPMELQMPSGALINVQGIGDLPEGTLIVRDGRFELLPDTHVSGLQKATPLAGLQRRSELAGPGSTDYGM